MNDAIVTKKKTGISRLLEIAGEKRGLLVLSGILSIISTLLMFVPFIATYFIVAELLNNAANPALSNIFLIRQWGLRALLSLLGALLFLYGV
ncbi:hypothetical protein [Clostridium formicaceticum]|uniref:Uncharacterized protein n=2 Tax=Clostridium formicaceticum TaxID=1497 RepID=A0AAC9RNC1_9CLOT|nr:hypothetical protein [Clostridium formicaceticum]ARE88854.1 hypothetical protein CLFO_32600 [Clostridium formicaceticum]